MHSRAYLLLERDYLQLQKANLFGISAAPVSDNLLEWVARVQGLKDSLWEGGVVQLYLRYSEGYNCVPPTVVFNTIPFHPNVDKDSGRPCIDFLDSKEAWNPRLSLTSILLTVQVMLSNPVLENAVNTEAAEMLRTEPSIFRQVVLDCVSNSLQIQSGTSISEDHIAASQSPEIPSAGPSPEHCRTVKRVCFEEYLKTWSGIATSKATQHVTNPLLEELVLQPALHAMHYGLQGTGLAEEANAQNEAYSAIMYGPCVKPKKKHVTIDEKLAKINKMKRIYLPSRTPEASTPLQTEWTGRLSSRDPHHSSGHKEELWEMEVDNLVAWTNSLHLEELEED
ncbi:ubiquitin-conjugating enzyme E2 U-like [Acipenser ruthenus]|uniref:ubiquitin-conjugating enzyme E2 U-like n=1 Tax=Acipenser ruthenus TaxID=7906 RepID=UPI00155FC43C|nr:ubiquitin-conjugating enzyme E2 U-like [Acipenser ruthenus]XP_058891088.1 ubiquitin-conjugating enzyme E2 U-like [Acipenser ruthenus]